MTRHILPTDIDFASKLLAADRPDSAVVAALVQRGVDSAGAAQLVGDLRNGRKVTPQIPSGLEIAPGRRSRSRTVADPGEQGPSELSGSNDRVRRAAQTPAKGRKSSGALWIIATVPICFGAVLVGGLISNRLHPAGDDPQPDKPRTAASTRELAPPTGSNQGVSRPSTLAGSLPTPPGEANGSGQKLSAAQLILELQPDGLHIGGSPVTPGNALACVSRILGAPTRTSQAGQPDTVIYAFDGHGLLIYSGKSAGKASIVLDCEAGGGANGTTSPFAGMLRVEGQVIRPDTDRGTVGAIGKLGLTNAGTDGSIMGGRYHDLDLAFAYHRTPQQLSHIQIGLR